jgi:diguanylate cyclase (GGDEF)-like protein/PAS domain S-box-containing protein
MKGQLLTVSGPRQTTASGLVLALGHNVTGDSLIDLLPDALLLVDAAGTIRQANRACATVFGWEPHELVGQSVEKLLPPGAREAHRLHRSGYLTEKGARQMRSGRPLWGLQKSGASVPLLITLAPTGEDELVLAVARPIPTPVMLELQERLTRAAVAAAANGIVITDVHGVIVHVNEAFTRLTGYASDEVIGQSPRILKSGAHDAAFYRSLWSTVLAGEVWSGEVVNMRKDGTTYVEEQTITPVRDEHGAISHFVAIKQDVTQRRADQAALVRRVDELTLLHELALLSVSHVAPALLAARAVEIVSKRLGLSSLHVEPSSPTDAPAENAAAEQAPDGSLVLPLRVGTRVFGILTAVFPTNAAIGPHEHLLLDTVASQLALALKNAYLLEQLEQRAHTDALTGLENRHRFLERARAEIERARRYGRALSLVMLDVDHFKAINDTRGHAHGDEVLRQLADALRVTSRLSDVVARFGGEEFVVLLTETAPDGAAAFVERVRVALAARGEQGRPLCTFSAGIANWGADHATIDQMLRAADTALYAAKDAGRNTSKILVSRPASTPDVLALRRVSSKPPTS